MLSLHTVQLLLHVISQRQFKNEQNSIHITTERESKELSADLEWILYSKSWSKYRLKVDLLLMKAASKNKT